MPSAMRALMLVLVVLGTPCTADGQRATSMSACTIRRIIDGDTVECLRDAIVIKVRLLGVDTPEPRQRPYGHEATQFLRTTIPPGTVVMVELDVRERDLYGRALAYLWTDSATMVNTAILRAGLGVVDIQSPNVKHAEELRAAARAAREANVGFWATPAFRCLPADFRRKRCS